MLKSGVLKSVNCPPSPALQEALGNERIGFREAKQLSAILSTHLSVAPQNDNGEGGEGKEQGAGGEGSASLQVPRLPAHVTVLLAEAAVVLLNPKHPLHKLIIRAVARGSRLDPEDLPLFSRLMFPTSKVPRPSLPLLSSCPCGLHFSRSAFPSLFLRFCHAPCIVSLSNPPPLQCLQTDSLYPWPLEPWPLQRSLGSSFLFCSTRSQSAWAASPCPPVPFIDCMPESPASCPPTCPQVMECSCAP